MLIFAHRGASKDAPENTIAAITEGLAQNADGIEVDVRLSCDNKVVVVHDKNLRRIAGCKKKISKCPAAIIRQIDAGIYKNKCFQGEKVPFLEEVLDAVPKGKLLQIDVKSSESIVPFIIENIKNSKKSLDEIMIISSKLKVLDRFHYCMSEIFTAWIYGRTPIIRTKLPKISLLTNHIKNFGIKGIDFDCRLNPNKKYMDLLIKNGIKAYSWTVDTMEKALMYKELGVTGIATNKPAFIRNALKKSEGKADE